MKHSCKGNKNQDESYKPDTLEQKIEKWMDGNEATTKGEEKKEEKEEQMKKENGGKTNRIRSNRK